MTAMNRRPYTGYKLIQTEQATDIPTNNEYGWMMDDGCYVFRVPSKNRPNLGRTLTH